MKKYLPVLKKCALFSQIEETDLLRILPCLGARVETFDKKYTIFAEGSSARYVGILLSGSAQIAQIDYFGNRNILAGILPSDVFAEEFACAEVAELPVSVIANELSDVMLIDCSHILNTCTNNCGFHQQLIFNLMKDLAIKNLLLHQRIEVTSKRSTREKLLAYLTMQAKQNGSTQFEIPFNRQELADYLEVERSGLSVEIGKLIREGIIQSDRKHFELL